MFLSLAPGLLELDRLASLVFCVPRVNKSFLDALDIAALPRSRIRHMSSTKGGASPIVRRFAMAIDAR